MFRITRPRRKRETTLARVAVDAATRHALPPLPYGEYPISECLNVFVDLGRRVQRVLRREVASNLHAGRSDWFLAGAGFGVSASEHNAETKAYRGNHDQQEKVFCSDKFHGAFSSQHLVSGGLIVSDQLDATIGEGNVAVVCVIESGSSAISAVSMCEISRFDCDKLPNAGEIEGGYEHRQGAWYHDSAVHDGAR
jgi:hypothetical protein